MKSHVRTLLRPLFFWEGEEFFCVYAPCFALLPTTDHPYVTPWRDPGLGSNPARGQPQPEHRSEAPRPKWVTPPQNSAPVSRSPSNWCPSEPFLFGGEGSPAKIDDLKKWYPYSNFSTGGPSCGLLGNGGFSVCVLVQLDKVVYILRLSTYESFTMCVCAPRFGRRKLNSCFLVSSQHLPPSPPPPQTKNTKKRELINLV